MPFEAPALDQMWIEFLLILGFVLTAGGLIAFALCVLGGCLDVVERRRYGTVRARIPDAPQVIVRLGTSRNEPLVENDGGRELLPAQSKQPPGFVLTVRKVI